MQEATVRGPSEASRRQKLSSTNYTCDFALARCTLAKLSEDMTPERAATLLKLPLNRRTTCMVVSRKALDECFVRALHNRYRVDDRDKHYEEKVTQRHIYEGWIAF